MNERIRELLQESYTHFGQGKYRTPELVAEKFAELIVWECFLIGAKYIQSNDDVSKFERELKDTFRS